MKRRILGILAFVALTAFAVAEETRFTESLTADDLAKAGLSQLTPEQRQRLDELVAAYKNGQLAAAQKAAVDAQKAKDEALAAKQKAEKEAKEAKAEVAESKKATKGFFAKAKVLLVPGTKIEYAVVKSTIVGKFEGWDGYTVFPLANGQYWRVANSGEHFFTPPMKDVEVEITPAALGGFWMNVPSLNISVRVKLLSEK